MARQDRQHVRGQGIATTDRITPKQFTEAEGVEDWRILGGDGATAYFRAGSYAAGARLVQAIGELPGVDDQRQRSTCAATA